MKQVEEKLADWKRLHDRLSTAQCKLNRILSQPHSESDLILLRGDVACLKVEADAAMKAVQAESSTYKSRKDEKHRPSSSNSISAAATDSMGGGAGPTI